jgi:3-hydroxyisobutyrate dehydrogenase-like beta-hydroxyacid dehydrogenase
VSLWLVRKKTKSITVLGLGGMGRAVAQCFASKGYQVHAWNRGKESRDNVRGMDNITVHDDLKEAVDASALVAMVVVADRNLQAATSIINSVPPTSWKDKTLIQYTTHEPTSIVAQERLMESLGAKLVGGQIVAVPHLVCTSGGSYLVSTTDDSLLKDTLPVLEQLGPVTTYPGNVGYAALAYLGLIQSLQFGLAGHELSLLLMKRYGAPRKLVEQYLELIQTNVPTYFKRFSGLATKAVLENDYESLARTFLPSDAYLEILEMQAYFCEQMGVVLEDTYLAQYLNVFRRLPKDGSVGPTAVVEHYMTLDDTDDKSPDL